MTSVRSLFPLLLLFAPAGPAQTLREAFESARAHRAIVATAELDRQIARERKREAVSRVLPGLSASSESQWRDQVTLPGSTGPFGESYQHTAKLTLEQPVFQGGSEYLGLKIASLDERIADLERARTDLELCRQVAEGFFRILTIRQEIATFAEQETLLGRRVGFLRDRARIGRSKSSEVTAARSQAARVTAQLSQRRSELGVAEREFLWLTGLAGATELADPVDERQPMEVAPEWESEAVRTPEIRIRELQWENARNRIGAARGGYFPYVGLEGNYYLDRAGILADSRWDFLIRARWEFFTGGETRAQAAAASMEARKLEIEWKDLKARAAQEYAAARDKLELQKETLRKLLLAEKLAYENSGEQQAEFERGLISNLEVLRALDDHLMVKSAYDLERFSTHLTWIRLKLLAGILP